MFRTTGQKPLWIALGLMSQMLLLTSGADAAICTSNGNGNWNMASTWSCGHVPTGGDTVIIEVGDTVTISQNHVYNGAPIQIQVFGVWYFIGGGSKITLPCGSHVEIMDGGSLLPNSNSGGHSETVRICGVTYWYYDEGPVAGYEIWPQIILPIQLIWFEPRVLDQDVHLDWFTASEIAISDFELRTSKDGYEWDHLAFVPAQGSNGVGARYVHIDPDREPGLWYYALHEIGTDGSIGPPEIRAVLVGSKEHSMTCMPNPVRDRRLTTVLKVPFEGVEMSVIGAMSRKVTVPEVVLEAEGLFVLDVSDLKPGYYVAVATLNGSRKGMCKFTVTH